jgi:hypothetical protein
MFKVAIYNSPTKNCGVSQYGRRLYSILKNGNIDLKYYEISTLKELFQTGLKEDICIFNYIRTGSSNAPLSWLSQNIIDDLRSRGKVVAQIFHAFTPLSVDYILHQNPNIQKKQNIFPLLRPIPKYTPKKKHPTEVPRIGSFGLGFKTKGFEKIVQLVNSQFDKADIVFNIFNAYYGDTQSAECNEVIENCKSIPLKSGITLSITNNFLTDVALIDFLAKNDINLFLYNYSGSGGISSVIDFALASESPIGIGSSDMFSHIYSDDICVDKTLIMDIITKGNAHILKFKEQFSNDKLNNQFEEIINTISKVR